MYVREGRCVFKLPFGEELFAGPGGRTTTQGYSQSDGVRQRFTRKERDVETGLDYFGARYYGSVQGRFTSVDPVALKLKHLNNPQDLNRYSYVANNPLVFFDPDGKEKIRITVRSFLPDSWKWGYAGDGHKTGEKIGAKDGFRIRETIVVETNPSRGGPIVPGSPRYEIGVSLGPNYVNPNKFGMPDVDQAKCANCSMTAVRTEEKGVSVNFTADVSNPLHPSFFASINFNLSVTVNPANQNDIVASVEGEHTKFPAFDVTVERLEAPNNASKVVYSYDPYSNPFNSGSSPLSLSPLAPKQQVTDPETAVTIPKKKPENE